MGLRNMLSLEQIQNIEFDILCYFKEFADQNSISFMLSNGTLLGAVKYNGFIPWDDDIDIFVPRQDYERLISEFKDTKQYKLFSVERDPNFKFPFAKLCDMKTIKEEKNIDNGLILGLDIDIFPLDAYHEDLKIAKKQVKKINKLLVKLNFSKLKYNRGNNVIRTLAKCILIFIFRRIGAKKYIYEIKNVINKNSFENIAFMGCAVWPIYGEREIVPANIFSDIIEVEFNGKRFPAPIGYDIYLRSLYGDYIKDPPLDKQQSHHSFKAYNL